jgi:hypothetical protein
MIDKPSSHFLFLSSQALPAEFKPQFLVGSFGILVKHDSFGAFEHSS